MSKFKLLLVRGLQREPLILDVSYCNIWQTLLTMQADKFSVAPCRLHISHLQRAGKAPRARDRGCSEARNASFSCEGVPSCGGELWF
jgi:hypothetical protein